jgi:hypothetical protein
MTNKKVINMTYLDVLAPPLEILRSAHRSCRPISPIAPSPPARSTSPCVEYGVPRSPHGGNVVRREHGAEFACESIFEASEQSVPAGEEDVAEERGLLRRVREAVHHDTFDDFDEAGLVDACYAGLEEDFRDADPFDV